MVLHNLLTPLLCDSTHVTPLSKPVKVLPHSLHPASHSCLNPSIHPFSRPPTYPSVCASVYSSCLFIHSPIHSPNISFSCFTHTLFHPSLHSPSTHHPPTHQFIHPYIHTSAHSSNHPFIQLSTHPSFICLPNHPFDLCPFIAHLSHANHLQLTLISPHYKSVCLLCDLCIALCL